MNQWAKIVAPRVFPDPYAGKIVPVKLGAPSLTLVRDITTGAVERVKAYDCLPCTASILGITGIEEISVVASSVELLGPDECARLDKLYGLDADETR